MNLKKSGGVTSRDVVNVVQRLVRPLKAGHAGTLDPLATGVLVICVGAGTRLIEYVQRMPKTYVGTFLLGRESDTEDVEGQVVELADPPRPTLDQITDAAAKLTGEIIQRPPAYSALKVAGRRAYELARKGKPVELKSAPDYRASINDHVVSLPRTGLRGSMRQRDIRPFAGARLGRIAGHRGGDVGLDADGNRQFPVGKHR